MSHEWQIQIRCEQLLLLCRSHEINLRYLTIMAHFVMMAVTKSKARTYMIPLVVNSVTHLE